jgi:hypothetical protein
MPYPQIEDVEKFKVYFQPLFKILTVTIVEYELDDFLRENTH